jgi:hypothetical protein
MKPFWDVVHATTPSQGDEVDVDRIAELIESRVGRVVGNEAVRKIIRDVLPHHLAAAWDGSREEAPLNTVEYAALAIGEDIRVAVKGDHRGKK